ncbi:MAG: DUF1080 domain-containing protein [Planctomycetota bacterium]|nr:DUF1080 domain-containing protein [Planctomycetota bacterium]
MRCWGAPAGAGRWVMMACVMLATGGLPASEPLFDGKTLDGWEGDTSVWRVEDGQIVAGSLATRQEKNDFLATTERFGNFELRLKVRLEGSEGFINSGIQFRSERVPSSHEMIGYQADFGAGYDGALYDESRRNRVLARPEPDVLRQALKPGEWNDYTIRAEGDHIQLWLNGVQTVDYTEPDEGLPAAGRIGLQIHGNGVLEVRFKDLEIERL